MNSLNISGIAMSKNVKIVSWVLQVVASVIMLQSLFFKFSGAPVSIYIFEQVGMEPWGRYLVGTSELIAGLLLLIPATIWLGAAMTMGVLAGAIFFHLTVLGIVVQDDGGTLFVMGLVTFLAGAVVLFLRRGQIPLIGPKLIGDKAD